MKTNIQLVITALLLVIIFSARAQDVKWAVHAGGTGGDRNFSIGIDKSKNVYTGVTNESTTSTSFNGSCTITGGSGNYDATFCKMDSNANCSTSKYFATHSVEIRAMHVDDSAYVYLTGYFYNPETWCSTLSSSGNYDIFVAKYTSSGTCVWAVKAGGTGNDYGMAINVDSSGNVYVSGMFQGTGTFGSINLTCSGTEDGFIAKYNRSGTIQWAKRFGGPKSSVDWNDEQGGGISNIANGIFYITGVIDSTATFGSLSVHSAHDTSNIFIAKMDTGGNFWWVKSVSSGGRSFISQGQTVLQDKWNNVFIAGRVDSAATFGSISSPRAGDFAARYDSSGTAKWVTMMGGKNPSGVSYTQPTVAIYDSTIYFSGTNAANCTVGQYSITTNGGSDILVSTMDYNGKPLCVVDYGGSGTDEAYDMACDTSGVAYVTGYFTSSTVAFGSTNLSPSGASDAFILKVAPTLPITSVAAGTNSVCKGTSFNVAFKTNYTYTSGNVFTAQLSDSTGTFGHPVTIGKDTATTAGTIGCIIPDSIMSNAHYRIRVVASNPSATGEEYPADVNITAQPPVAPAAQSVCSASAYTFTFSSVTSGTGGNEIEWAHNNSFTGSHILSSPATILDTVNSGTIDTLWIRSKLSTTGCVSDVVVSTTATVNALPANPGNPTSNSPQCVDAGVTLTRSGSVPGGQTWYWQTSSSGTSTTNSGSTYNVTSSGTYYINAQNNSTLCWSSGAGSLAVTVNPLPSAPTSVTPSSPTSICNGASINLNATSSGNTIYWFTVSSGGGSVGTSASGVNFSASPTVNTTYYAQSQSSAGCNSSSRTATALITVDTLPANPGNPSSNSPQCADAGVTLTASGSAPSGQTWYWQASPTGTSKTNSASTYNVTSSGTYYINAQNNSTLCWSSGAGSLAVVVNSIPSPPTGTGSQTMCSDTAYRFSFDDTAHGSNGNEIEWATNSGFTGSNILVSPAIIYITVNSGADSMLRIRSKDSVSGCVSSAITVNAIVNALPNNLTTTLQDDTICNGSNTNINISNTQIGKRFDLRIGATVVSSGYGNDTTLILNTGVVSTTSIFNVLATDTSTGCNIQFANADTVYTTNACNTSIGAILSPVSLSQTDTSFYQIKSTAESYLKYKNQEYNAGVGQGDSLFGEDGEEMQFGRWVKYWSTRAGYNGSMLQNYSAGATYFSTPYECENDYGANWQCIGPYNSLNDANCCSNSCGIGSLQRQNQGRITAVAADLADTSFQTFFAGGDNGGVFKTTDGGANWVSLTDNTPLAGAGISSIQIHPANHNYIFVTINSFSSNNGLVRDAYSNGIWYTSDGGNTWNPTALKNDPTQAVPWAYIYDVTDIKIKSNSTLANTVIYGLANTTFWKLNMDLTGTLDSTTQLLYTWDTIVDSLFGVSNGFNDFEIGQTNPDTVILCASPFLLCSADEGNSFHHVYPQVPTGYSYEDTVSGTYRASNIYVTSDHNNRFWVMFSYATNSQNYNYVEYSDNAGQTWNVVTNSSSLSIYPYPNFWIIHPYNDSIMYSQENSETARCVQISIDSGKTSNGLIVDTTGHVDVRALEIFPTNQSGEYILLCGNDGGVSLSRNGGPLKTINGQGLNVGQYFGVASSETNCHFVLAGAQDGSLSYFNGKIWSQIHVGGDMGEPAISPESDSIFYLTVDGGDGVEFDRSIDNNATELSNQLTMYTGGLFVEGVLAIDPANPNVIYTGGSDLYRSADGGNNWNTIFNINNYDTSNSGYLLSDVEIAPGNHHIIYTAKEVGSYKPDTTWIIQGGIWQGTCNDTNNNCSWINITSNLEDSIGHNGVLDNGPKITGLCIDPNNSNRVFVSLSGFYETDTTVYKVMVRYYDDTTSSYRWQNMSNGLPNMPANCIVYQNGSNDILYLGTDVGVYWWDKPNNTWHKYCGGLPDIIINRLRINYCGNILYAATWGRGIWQANLIPLPYDTITAPGQVWSTSRSVYQSVLIDSLATLTIDSSAVISMAGGTNIIIKPGGKLIVDTATITNGCNTTWGGIYVEGNKLKFQDLRNATDNYIAISRNQGFAYLNNALIENSNWGVQAWDPFDYGWVDDNQSSPIGGTGGIIRAVNTSFQNCRVAAGFDYYHFYYVGDTIGDTLDLPNLSYFYKDTFNVDTNYYYYYNGSFYVGSPFYAHVTMWGTTGIQFQGCDFENKDTRNTNPFSLGSGINSIDANYTLSQYVAGADTTRNIFKYLTYGVNASNSNSNASVNIYDGNFTDNINGVWIASSNYSNVNGNIFTVGHVPDGISISGYKLNMLGTAFLYSTQFGHTLNKFNSNNGIDANTIPIGSGFYNTSTTNMSENQSFDNAYQNISFASLANYINKSIGPNGGLHGLQFLCNTNSNGNEQYDFTVYQDPPDTLYGVRNKQGDLTDAAANSFSTPSIYIKNQVNNLAENNITYYWFSSGEKPNNNDIFGVTVSGVPSLADRTCPVNNTGSGGQNGCLICGLTPTQVIAEKISFDSIHIIFGNYNNELASLIDGGNAGSLQHLIQSADTANADSVRIVLDSISPYLSETVLSALANRTDIYTADTLYNILYANPDALGQNNLIGSISPGLIFGGSRLVLSSARIDSLIARESDTTARTVLESNVSYYSEQFHQLSRDIIMSMLQDSAGYNHAEYRYWLSKLHDAESDYMCVEDYWVTGYSDSAIALLDSIPVRYSMTVLQDSVYQTFKNLMLFKSGIRTDSMSIAHLDSTHISSLHNIAQNGTGLGAIKAQNVLNFFYGYTYHSEFQTPGNVGSARMLNIASNPQDRSAVETNTNASYLKVYPNPTSSFENFEFKLPDNNTEGVLVVADMTGQTMSTVIVSAAVNVKTIDIKQWINGIYLYRLTSNNKVVGSGRFEVIK